MNEMQQEILRAKDLINQSERILVIAHRSVDGDAYGSSMSLYFSLTGMGKTVHVVNELPIASEHHFLGHSELVVTQMPDIRFDCIIICDCGEFRRIGSFADTHAALFDRTPTINIDHHEGNDLYGTVNIVDTKASSTCEILHTVLQNGFHVDDTVRSFLMYGIIRDTNRFKNSLSPRTFEAMNDLYSHLSPHVYDRMVLNAYKSLPLQIHQICAEALRNPILLRGGTVMGCIITQEMFGRYSINEHELGDYCINEVLPSIRGKTHIFLMKEVGDRIWKVSFRAREDGYNVSRLAKKLG